MDYEKLYKEALERARIIHNEHRAQCHDIMTKVFPELCESEDEQHRKWILEYLQDGLQKADEQFKGQFTSAIAWLEKQGEQKSAWSEEIEKKSFDYENANIPQKDFAPKAEPKFKVGDCIVQENIGTFKIIEICKSWYEVVSYNDGIQYSIGFDKENDCHLWTINDANEGDVLSKDNIPFIFKSWDNNCKAYCGITDSGVFEIVEDDFSWCNGINVTPSTKEQREFLFQKMDEAGYTWDFRKETTN